MSRFGPVLVLITAFCCGGAANAGPRALSEVERQATILGADYLARGPISVWERLSRHSPLRALPRADALAEIEVRCGPARGARWELATVVPSLKDRTAVFGIEFPSGLDETLIIDFVEEPDGPKVQTITSFAEPSRHALPPAFRNRPPASSPASTPPPSPSGSATQRLATVAASSSGGAILAFVLALAARRRPILGLSLAGAGSIVLLAGVGLLRRPEFVPGLLPADPKPELARRTSTPRLSALLPLRRALTSGEGVEAALRVKSRAEADPVARLWSAQWAFQNGDLAGARRTLASLPATPNVPLAEVLRARIAFLESKEVDAAIAYERAITAGPGQDGLWTEAAAAFAILGFEERARTYFRRLERIGTRNADVWYGLARLSVFDERNAEAKAALATAWDLKPVVRGDLVGQPIPWDLLREQELQSRLRLDAPEEPVVLPSPGIASKPIPVPAGAEVHAVASWLSVTLPDGAELVVPGGAFLAPEGTLAEDAGALDRAQEDRALASLPRLVVAVSHTGALALPGLRRQVERASAAAVRRNRWADVTRLTDGIAGNLEQVPFSLVTHRVEALRRTGREAEARRLAASFARSPATARRGDPWTLYHLAELLLQLEEYDLALEQVARAQARLRRPAGEDLVRRAHLEQRLKSSFEVVTTAHFKVLYPSRSDQLTARRVAEILEAERGRLQGWIPGSGSGVTVVHLMDWDEFQSSVAPQAGIVGLFDGRIRVPLAGVGRFVPEIVAILTHELAHALIADATRGYAPKWLHEGLAQHVEMAAKRSNPIPHYSSSGRYLSLPIVEGVLEGMADMDLVVAAYDETCWLFHYIEVRYGSRAIPSLLEAFAEGLPAEDAVPRALGVSLTALDAAFRAWASTSAPPLWRTKVVRYDAATDPGAPRMSRAEEAPDPEKPRKPVVIPESLRKGRIRWDR